MGTGAKWYFLDPEGQPDGPHQTSGMADLLKLEKITVETPCWCEGRMQWQCARDIAELDAAFGTVKDLGSGDAQTDRVDLLDAFKQEIAALEKGVESTTIPSLEDAPPSPEDKSFIDDDGTEYIWDSVARKYKSKDFDTNIQPPAPVAEYDVQTMTYEAVEEEIPSLAEARRLQEEESLYDFDVAPPQKTGLSSDIHDKATEEEEEKEEEGEDEEDEEEEEEAKKGVKRKNEELNHSDPSKTTSIYVTGLPDDVSIQEMAASFGKCGIIRQGEDSVPKIKLYRDKKTGMLKGDGLVTYLKRPSVELAVNILDGTPFRPGMVTMMKVQEARFELKGEYKRPTKPKKKPKKKGARQDNLLAWGGFDDRLPASKITIILKHMFLPEEIIGHPIARSELEMDIKGECEKLGTVDRVTIFDQHPEGIVAVRFTTEDAATLCKTRMNGRFFAGRQLQAENWDGFTKYSLAHKETEEQEAARLEQFAKDLEET